MLGSAWTLAALTSIPQLFVWQIYVPRDYPTFTQCVSQWVAKEDEYNQTSSDGISWRVYSAYHLLIIFWIPLIILVICYGFILKAVIAVARTAKNDAEIRRQSDPHILEREALYLSNGHERLRKAKVKAWKMTLVLVTLYMTCWFPYNTLSWWKIIHPDSYKNTENHLYFLHSLIVLNSVLNPLVYGRINIPCRLVLARPVKKTKKKSRPGRKRC
uniref:G-protein coupled receptors family 1 profile domain-containing protein n=1 Tax=Plectus sambesii TaxID=2011161 RepID=A0A914XLB4_9BILA